MSTRSRHSIAFGLEVRRCIKQTLDTAIHGNVPRILMLRRVVGSCRFRIARRRASVVSLEKAVEGRGYAAKTSLTRVNARAMAITKADVVGPGSVLSQLIMVAK